MLAHRALVALSIFVYVTLFVVTPSIAQVQSQPASSSSRIYLPLIALAALANPIEQQVVDLTNQLRQQHGCPPLTLSPQLTIAARGHSQDMANRNYFSHIDLTGHNSGWRAQQAGYSGTAGWENIAAGYMTAMNVVSSWYNERPPNDGHRRNMLNCALTDIGVGYGYNANSSYGSYWTQDFGQR